MGKSSSPPPAPDYTAAAKQTAQGNAEAALVAQYGNMVNQNTPYGSVTYTPRQVGTTSDGTGIFSWTQNVKLSPEQQKAYQEDMAMNSRLRGVADQGINYVQSALNAPLTGPGDLTKNVQGTDFVTSAGDPQLLQQNVSDAVYRNQTQYLDPQFERQQAGLENQLANQGITRGSEAWNNAMGDLGRQKQQAYESARQQATQQGIGAAQSMFGMGLSNAELANQAANQRFGQGLTNAQLYNQGVQQEFANRQTLRQEPINILNAVRTGSQMQSAQMPQVGVSSPGQLAVTSGPDYLGATTASGQYNQGLYNAGQAASGNQTSGLMGLAGTGIMAGAML